MMIKPPIVGVPAFHFDQLIPVLLLFHQPVDFAETE
jgi:hypothetical protein